jgi:phage gp29-like protein
MGILDTINALAPGMGARVVATTRRALAQAERGYNRAATAAIERAASTYVSLTGTDAYGSDGDTKIGAYGNTIDVETLLRERHAVPPNTSLTQIQPINVSQWTVPGVRETLDVHELGYFLNSAQLVDAMGRDDRITGCLNTRVRALAGKSGINFSVTPNEGASDKKLSQRLAEEIESFWYYTCPESAMSHILRDAVMLGVAFARIHWDRVNGRRVPRLEPWNAHTVYWDWSIQKYRAVAREGQFIIEPGNAEWFVYEPGGYRSWMLGAVRSLGVPYVIRQYTYRDWYRYCEKHGLPILAIREPSGSQWEKHKAGFWAKVQRLGSESTLRLPYDKKNDDGFGIEFVEPKDKSWAAFEALINRLDVNIAVDLLGQNLTTEVQGGSHAAAMAHNLVRLDYLDADAQTLSTALREQVWKLFVRFNEGTVNLDNTPWPAWDTRPPEDKKNRADVVKTFADAAKTLVQQDVRSAFRADLSALADSMGIPEEEAKTEAKPDDVKPTLFAYHLQYQLLSKNEARRLALNLPAVAGGDVPAAPVAAQPAETPLTALSAAAKMGTHGGTEEDRVRARSAINQKIRSGKVPDPNDVPCADCGHEYNGKDGIRHEYDHYKGYSEDHALDVKSVCTDCHKRRSLKEYGRLSAMTAISCSPVNGSPGLTALTSALYRRRLKVYAHLDAAHAHALGGASAPDARPYGADHPDLYLGPYDVAVDVRDGKNLRLNADQQPQAEALLVVYGHRSEV